MKIKIINENITVSTEIKKDLLIKDLLKKLINLKELNGTGKELILLDSTQNILDPNSYIKFIQDENNSNEISEIKENIFYLVKYDSNGKMKHSNIESFTSNNNMAKIDMEDLIMKATGAKSKIDIKSIKPRTDRISLIDDLFNSSLSSMIMGNGAGMPGTGLGQQNQLNQLLNILRPIMDSDVAEGEIAGNRVRPPGRIMINRMNNPNTVVPDENLLNNLKEMGFPEEQCRRALIMSRNNISRATDLLLSDNLDYLPNENQNNAQSSNNNQNNNQSNQEEEEQVEENQMDEDMEGDEEMIDIPENLQNDISIQNLPNMEIYLNHFINNSSQVNSDNFSLHSSNQSNNDNDQSNLSNQNTPNNQNQNNPNN